MVNAARLVSSANLESVNFAKLGNLKVIHKVNENKEMSIISSVLVVSSAMLGTVFSYMTYRSMRRQSIENDENQNIGESQHELIR